MAKEAGKKKLSSGVRRSYFSDTRVNSFVDEHPAELAFAVRKLREHAGVQEIDETKSFMTVGGNLKASLRAPTGAIQYICEKMNGSDDLDELRRIVKERVSKLATSHAMKHCFEKVVEEKAVAEKETTEEKASSENKGAEEEEAAADEKAAKEKAAADENAAKERAAADENAAKEKAAADEKAADENAAKERAAADEKAAKKRAAADEKAAKEKAAADENAAKEKAAADEKAAKEKAAADENAAKENAAKERAAADENAGKEKAAADEKAAKDKAAAEEKTAEEEAAKEKLAAKKAVVQGDVDMDDEETTGAKQADGEKKAKGGAVRMIVNENKGSGNGGQIWQVKSSDVDEILDYQMSRTIDGLEIKSAESRRNRVLAKMPTGHRSSIAYYNKCIIIKMIGHFNSCDTCYDVTLFTYRKANLFKGGRFEVDDSLIEQVNFDLFDIARSGLFTFDAALGKQGFDRFQKVIDRLRHVTSQTDDEVEIIDSRSVRQKREIQQYVAGPAKGFSKKARKEDYETAESKPKSKPKRRQERAGGSMAASHAPNKMPSSSHGAMTSNERDLFERMLSMKDTMYSAMIKKDQAGSMAAAALAHQTSSFLEKMAMAQIELGEHERAQKTVGFYLANQAAASGHAFNSGERFQ